MSGRVPRSVSTPVPVEPLTDIDAQISFEDSSGNNNSVSGTNALPVNQSDRDLIRTGTQTNLLEDILIELKKLNKYAEEILEGEVL